MPGQTPRMPRSFLGAAATAAVSVPCALSIGKPPRVERLPPANSGWLTSAVESTSASSGLVGVTGGGTRRGVDDRGAPGRRGRRAGRAPGACIALGEPVGLGVEEQALGRAAPRRARARGPSRPSRRRCRCGDAPWRAATASAAAEGCAPTIQVDSPPRCRPPALSPGSTIGGEQRGARGRERRQHEQEGDAVRTGGAHRATVGTQSAHGRSGVPVRTARSSAGARAVALLAVLVVERRQHAEDRRRRRSRRPTRAGRAGG